MKYYLNCDLDICIHNNNHKCILDEISINGDGCCADIIMPDIPEDELARYKKETVINLERKRAVPD